MNLILPLFLGFLIAFVGIIPPGLINMTAAKVSLKDGRNEAIFFAIGATIIIFFQSLLALLFANFINNNPSVINSLEEIGLFIFAGLTIYFFWKAKKPQKTKSKIKARSKNQSFLLWNVVIGTEFISNSLLCFQLYYISNLWHFLLYTFLYLFFCNWCSFRFFFSVLPLYPIFQKKRNKVILFDK